MRLLRFHGEDTTLDLSRVIDADPRLRRLRDDIALRHPRERAQHIAEDIVASALRRYGDHVLAVKSDLLDHIVDLRDRLDGLYQGILHSGDATGRRPGQSTGDFEAQLRDVEGLYQQLDEALTDLGQPVVHTPPPPDAPNALAQELSDAIEAQPPSTPRQAPRPIDRDATIEPGSTRSRLERLRIRTEADGSRRVTFASGDSAVFSVENGAYRVRTYDASGRETANFAEFDTLHTPYRNRPSTTRIMNAHHGLQNDLMRRVFQRFGYDGTAVPTIWLRDGKAGSPHGMITDIQRAASTERRAARTYSEIRDFAIRDLAASQVPTARISEYLTAMDNYFRTAVLPNIPPAQRGLLGSWTP